LNYVSWKQRKTVAADLKPIYQASTVEEAEQRLGEFAAKWDGAYPTISQMWRRNWEHLTPFFAYPADIRKVIYTTNAVESLNMSAAILDEFLKTDTIAAAGRLISDLGLTPVSAACAVPSAMPTIRQLKRSTAPPYRQIDHT
jgi:hypothetical protein